MKQFLVVVFCFLSASVFAQPQGFDCFDAIQICSDVFSVAATPVNHGTITTAGTNNTTGTYEFNIWDYNPSCYPGGAPFQALNPDFDGEKWYYFEITDGGELCMTISPPGTTDFDWILFNVTGQTCTNIQNGTATVASCNFEQPVAGNSTTGFNGLAGAQNNPCINANNGDEFLLWIGSYTTTPGGYTVNISGNFSTTDTAQIFDQTTPQINQSPALPAMNCGAVNPMTINFSEEINCGTLDQTDFSIIAPSGNVLTAPGDFTVSCTGGTSTSVDVTPVAGAITENGTHKIKIVGGVEDLCQNPLIDSINFTVNTDFDFTVATAQNTGCDPNFNGSASLTFTSNPSSAYEVLWPGDVYTANKTNSDANLAPSTNPPGFYSVTVRDANGCVVTKTFDITNDPGSAPSADLTVSNSTCTAANGSITASNFTNLPGTINYTWEDAQGNAIANPPTNPILSNIDSGTYFVTLTASNGCTYEASEIIQPNGGTQLIAAVGNITPDTCAGNDANFHGSIDLTIASGTAPYSINWSGPNGYTAITEDINGLEPGQYTVTIQDDNGCIQGVSSPLLGNVTNYDPSYNGTNVVRTIIPDTCSNSVGEIRIADFFDLGNSNASYAPFSFAWNGGASTQHDSILNGQASGSGAVLITDKYGCSATHNYTITNFKPNISIALTSIEDTCAGQGAGPVGAIQVGTIVASSGTITPPFSFSLDGGASTTNNTFSNIAGDANATHTLLFTDDNGCDTTISGIIVDNIELNYAYSISSNQDTCSGSKGSIDITVDGTNNEFVDPIFYGWSTGNSGQDLTSQSALSAGNYLITVEDFYGCSQTINQTVSNFEPDFVLNFDVVEDTCTPNTGFDPMNNYFGALNVTATTPSNPTYNPGIINYSWANSIILPGGAATSDLSSISSGDYQVSIIDENGCEADSTIFVPEVQNTLQFSTSSFTITDALCESATGSVKVDNLLINSQTISANDPNLTFLWNHSNGVDDELNDVNYGNYSLTVLDQYGCASSATNILVPRTDDPDLSLGLQGAQTLSTSCFGIADAQVTVQASDASNPAAPYNYTWPFGTTTSGTNNETGTTLDSGNYNVSVTDTNGCETTLDVYISYPPQVTINSINDTIICENGTASLTANATGGTVAPCSGPACYTYQWSGANITSATNTQSITAQPTTQEVYEVIATDANNCQSDPLEVTVNVYDPLSITFAQPQYSICEGDNQDLSVIVSGGNGDNEFLWNTGQTDSIITINLTAGQTFDVTVNNGGGCESTSVNASTAVNVNPLAVIDFDPDKYVVCPGDSVNVTINVFDPDNVYQLGWGDNSANYTDSNQIIHVYETPGSYTVTMEITTLFGCVSNQSLPNQIVVNPEPENSYVMNPNPPTTINPEVVFTNTTQDVNYTIWWVGAPPTGDAFAADQFEYSFDNVDSTYQVFLVNVNQFGCTDTTVFFVKVKEETILFIPNAFTPDEDNLNSTWGPVGGGINETCGYLLQVFNRYANMVFETRDFNEQWNGRVNNTGRLVEQGLYNYKIQYVDAEGKEQELVGMVLVINPTEP